MKWKCSGPYCDAGGRRRDFAARASDDRAEPIVAVVDEESEVTQYRLALPDPKGELRPGMTAEARFTLRPVLQKTGGTP